MNKNYTAFYNITNNRLFFWPNQSKGVKIPEDEFKKVKTSGRELDNAFENYDGDEMCAALYRMALRSQKLMQGLKREWSRPGSFERTFIANAEKFQALSSKELSEHARQTRERKGETS